MHPSKEELSGFLLGKLPPNDTETVAEHLAQCFPCQETVVGLEVHQDTLLQRLQQPPPVAKAASPQVKQAIAKVAALASPPHDERFQRSADTPPPSAAAVSSLLGGYNDGSISADRISPMALDLETVVKQLTDSGIIAAETLKDFIPPKADPKTSEALVQALVKNEKLTNFQGQQVKGGKSKALKLGAYTLLDKIGAGGMGQVFKAEHRKMHRLVAIKMLPPSMMKDAAAIARFEREVTAAAKLRHPNIVAADDAAEANGAHFLVMEYVEGKDLSALVKKNGPFPVAKAVNYVLQAAKGLEFAHSEGVVHRDIKPANLLLDKKGMVKILDMGLARIEAVGDVAAAAELTGTGTIMGTVDYMAPEQGLSTKHADARADIYSLGCTLHYLLIGKATYGGETLAAKLLAHHNEPIPELRQLREEVPEQVQSVFRKMVAKKVGDRYQTMTEVVAELEKCQSALNAAASSSTGVWTDPATDKESDMSIAFAHQRLARIDNSDNPFAAPERQRKPGLKGPPWKNTKLLIGAGAAGFLLVLLGVIVILRNQKGKEVGRMELPDGTSVEVRSTTPPPQSTALASSVPAIGTVPAPAKAPFDATQAKAHQAAWAKYLGTTVEQKNPVGMTLVLIPPGEFLMGSTDEQVAAALNVAEEIKTDQGTKDFIQKAERPQHRVVITKPLLMSATEVTVGQFRKFVEASKYVTEAEQYRFGDSGDKALSDKVPVKSRGLNWKSPGYVVTDDSPVAQVTWNDACAYCAWLSEQDGRRPWYRSDGKGGWLIAAQASGYRLPNEAEWEYACRAGTTTQYSFGDDYAELEQYGWYKNAGGKAQPVGMKLPNPFGLFDMHGNLSEWCQDFFDWKWYEKPQPLDPKGPSSGSARVIRGGHWNSRASHCRTAYRSQPSPSHRGNDIGFRVVRVWDATADSQLAIGAISPQPNQPWNTPAFQAWMKTVAAMPAEQQIEAVSKKLMELNPGFGGKVTGPDPKGPPKIVGGVVTELGFVTDNVTDISPVRALVGLKVLGCDGSSPSKSKLSDLSPLHGMRLTTLYCSFTQVSDLSPLYGMPLTTLVCHFTQVSDLSPLHGMPLAVLNCDATLISDLSPLQGMPLTQLNVGRTPVTDLSPLRGMPLTNLSCWSTQVFDISPLRGMPLTALRIENTKTSDLSPLQGTPLASLHCDNTPMSDLSPLQGMGLARIRLTPKNITKGLDIIRQMKSLKTIDISGEPKDRFSPDEFWKKYDAGDFGKPITNIHDPAFQQWMKTVAALPAEEQVDAVSKKLMELNPGFDGAVTGWFERGTPKIENGVVTEFGFLTDNVTDISPVRALVGLKVLSCSGSPPTARNGILSDLSPLRGMKLEKLICIRNKTLSDLSPLEGMPLTELAFAGTSVSDLSPVRGMKLTSFDCVGTPVSDLSPLKGMKLTGLNFGGTQVSGLLPLQGMPLRNLYCVNTNISDLSPLEGMPLTALNCSITQVSDLSPLRGMPLASLQCGLTHVSDLSPLRGAPLTTLFCAGTQVSDLSPLQGTNLETIIFTPKNITNGLVLIRQMSSLKAVGIGDGQKDQLPPDEFWKRYDAGEFGKPLTKINDPAFQAWMKTVAALPAEKQVEAVSKRLMELNPGFDGKVTGWFGRGTPKIENGVVTELGLITDEVVDLSPVRALAGLRLLFIRAASENSKLADMTALHGMKLTSLDVGGCGQVQDLSPLKGMPLTSLGLLHCKQVSDLTPLEGMALTNLDLAYCDQVRDLTPLRAMKLNSLGLNGIVRDLTLLQGMPLTSLGLWGCGEIRDLSPLRGMRLTSLQVGECGQVRDLMPLKGMPLTSLGCYNTSVSDLSPLRGMNLTNVTLTPKNITKGLEVIRQMNSLKTIAISDGQKDRLPPDEFWKKYDAGEFGKPDVAKPLTNINDPAFQAWMKTVAALPAEKQIEAVSKKLMELNPGFDGKVTGADGAGAPKIENGVVMEFRFVPENVTDISPVRALLGLKFLAVDSARSKLSDLSPLEGMPLTHLDFPRSPVTDLSPLRGMPLTELNCGDTKVSDLSPLRGIPLNRLEFYGTQVFDLSPLQGMPLRFLNFDRAQVSDLSPLQGIPLAYLHCDNTPVSDLTPLQAMKLVDFRFTPKNITKGLDVIRQMKSLQTIGIEGGKRIPPTEFWKKYDAGEFGKPITAAKPITNINDPAFQQWMKTVAALPAEKQVEAVSRKLVELNPGFDGKLGLTIKNGKAIGVPKVENGVVTELQFFTDDVTDISPVRALASLTTLFCGGTSPAKSKLSDLSPLQGMKLTKLECRARQVFDLSPLQGMELTDLGVDVTQVSSLSPLQGMPLKHLNCIDTQISDLSSLRGMPLFQLYCKNTQVSDLSPLADCKSLGILGVTSTKVTPAGVAALQKALPNCKILWDDPAKAVATQPNQSWNTPAFQAWMKTVAALPAEKQIEAVSKKLIELNPGFDGKVSSLDPKGTPKIEKNVVTEFGFITDNVTDISPVRALAGLKWLSCGGNAPGKGQLSDLSPLQGMPLTKLACQSTSVSNLSPLQGMPLDYLHCAATKVSDLSPLQGMPLATLHCDDTQVSTLSPLQGMNLKDLYCDDTQVSDLSPLQGMNLNDVWIAPKNITKGLDLIRQMKSLKTIGIESGKTFPPAEFWKKYDAGEFGKPTPTKPITAFNDPAFQAWMKTVAAMPADKQIEAVAQKLVELNPGFDGTVTGDGGKGTPKIEKGVVTEFGFFTDNVTDISPVRALVGLKILFCDGPYTKGGYSGVLSDLSPLQGMPLTSLNCAGTQVADLTPLQGMPLTSLICYPTQVSDLSPLKGMPLTTLACEGSQISDLSPLQGMPLKYLRCGNTQVSDLSPLEGMNLTSISITSKNITKGLDILRRMKSLKGINDAPTPHLPPDEFWKKYDAGEFGKPGAPGKPITNINDPAFQQWMKTVAALPAEKQVEAVSKRLMELNTGFDGKVFGSILRATPKIENGVVTEFGLFTDNVTDISPVRALAGLKVLNCGGTSLNGLSRGVLRDLSPLQGMPLTNLQFNATQVSDLSPLQGMKLKVLFFPYSRVSDLSPLKGMLLENLNSDTTLISDLSPLQGMPLKLLVCNGTPVSDLSPLDVVPLTTLMITGTKVSDLSPLQGMSLTEIRLTPKNITKGLDVIRQMKSLKTIGLGGGTNAWPPAEFWKKYDAGEFGKPITAKPITNINDPAFQAWMKTVAAMPAEKQIEAVSKRLMELNPGFDGQVIHKKIEKGAVTELHFWTDKVADISPVRALAGLQTLSCNASTNGIGLLADLSPLSGMNLTGLLDCGRTQVSDLSPVQGMPLKSLSCYGTQVSSLSPLGEMSLQALNVNDTQVSSLSPLLGMPLLSLAFGGTRVSDLSPLEGMALEQMWLPGAKVNDLSPLRGMPLRNVNCAGTKVADLSPLKGMPLTGLLCVHSPVSDLSPLQDCKSLTKLEVGNTKVTASGVAALQKALPKCKIEWDDPAKPKTPEPAASSTK